MRRICTVLESGFSGAPGLPETNLPALANMTCGPEPALESGFSDERLADYCCGNTNPSVSTVKPSVASRRNGSTA